MYPPRHARRTLSFRLLRLSLIPLLVRQTLQRRRVTLILYHDPDPHTFERHLRVLQRLYTIVDLRSVVEALRSGSIARLPRRSLVITLDDGYRGNHALLPVLERVGIPVTIFACASIVGTERAYWFNHTENTAVLKRVPDADRLERLALSGFTDYGSDREALSDEEIQEMAALVDFQSHGLSHRILPRCDDAAAQTEVAGSREILGSRYGFDIYAFSYPNGDYGEREVRMVRDAGYLCGVTLDHGFNTARTDVYRLRRIPIDDVDGIDELLVKCSGLWGAVRSLLGRRAAEEPAMSA